MMIERRQWPRRRTLEAARIVFDEDRVECAVHNLSARGALLHVKTVAGIPDTFELHIDGVVHPAWVIWKDTGKLGVFWFD